MGKIAEYIDRIEISSLWDGRKHITWKLHPEVNILSGVNGVGKSTILNKLVSRLKSSMALGEITAGTSLGVKVDFYPSDATSIRFDVIKSFDKPFIHGGLLDKLVDTRVATELDWQLYQLQRRYLDYQVNIGNRMIELLTNGGEKGKDEATRLSLSKAHFQNIVDDLFSETGKSIDRKSNELVLLQMGEPLSPYQLSSGEKQILVILLTALTENNQHYVLFMDEPEISLHVEWQERLIGLIRELNPNVQIVLTTHSPAVIMHGWMDDVTDVSDISS